MSLERRPAVGIVDIRAGGGHLSEAAMHAGRIDTMIERPPDLRDLIRRLSSATTAAIRLGKD